MKYNNELRNIDTQEKAYLLGFMFGDGCISEYNDKNDNVRHTTKISIIKTDEDLINRFNEIFPFLNLGECDFSKYNENSGIQSSVANSSLELYNDFLLNGVYPRKSYENACKLKLPDIEDKLLPHFIRGFFDADGSVYTQANRPNLIRIEFCSVSKELITSIDDYLKQHDINSWRIRPKEPTGQSVQIVYALEFIRTSEVHKLIDFMYKDHNIALKRKADKCLNHKIINKVLDRKLNCIRCNSTQVKRNGIRGNSIRYICSDCGKGFSIKNN